MCNPLAVMAVATVASAGYGLVQQSSAAKRSERFARATQKDNEKQIHASQSSKADNRQRRMRRERARLRALSAETGLSGITSGTVIDNAETQAGFDIANIGLNEQFQTTNSRNQLQSNLNNIQQPDFIGTALNTGLQLYGQNQAFKPKPTG